MIFKNASSDLGSSRVQYLIKGVYPFDLITPDRISIRFRGTQFRTNNVIFVE
jgi:hypothetical protein